jgi:hypothetical protein
MDNGDHCLLSCASDKSIRMWNIAATSSSCLRVFSLDLVEGSVVGLVALANPHLLLYTCDDAGHLTSYSVEGPALVRQSCTGFKSALTCVSTSRVREGDSTVLGLMIAGVNGTLFVDDCIHVLTGLEAIEAPECGVGVGVTGSKAGLRSRAPLGLRPDSSSGRPNTASSILSKPTAQANAEKVKDITIDLRGQGPKAPKRSPESRRLVNDLSSLALSPDKDFESGSAGKLADGGFDVFKSQVIDAPDSSFQPFGNAAAAFSGMPGVSPPKRGPTASPAAAKVGEKDETAALKLAIGGVGGGATAGVAPKTNQPRRMRGAMSAKSSRIFDMRREMAKNR